MGPTDYLSILKTAEELPFPVGKKLLIAILQGNTGNESVKRNNLSRIKQFGSLHLYSDADLSQEIDALQRNGLIDLSGMRGKEYIKVITLTEKGRAELADPSLHRRRLAGNGKSFMTEITESDKSIFAALGAVLEKYNDLQKKAIISDSKSILCLAGAGTGKTTVLTKRIEFMTAYRSVPPRKILAITFTRKAKQEMLTRLRGVPQAQGVSIETFNSFSERFLRAYGDLVYGKKVAVITFPERIRLLQRGLESQNLTMDRAIDIYFSDSQIRSKTKEQLSFTLMNDCYAILELFKVDGRKIDEFSCDCSPQQRKGVDMILSLCRFIDDGMKRRGLRDFTDQLIDCYHFLESHAAYIPKYSHILIDEYQDVNAMQIALIRLLAPENLFVVGDPRQSIFGWRGSKVGYILNFLEDHPDATAIALIRNYRATEPLVRLANASIRKMGLPDLEPHHTGEKDIKVFDARDEGDEYTYVMKRIKESTLPPEEIFVLARTNRQLNELSALMKKESIPHSVRSDEQRRPVEPKEGEVILATIHAIKGLEAELVIVMGCTPGNFPCKSSDHPILDLLKREEYDKEEEERRLFYVAISRAKRSLILTYSGKSMTWFITDEMKRLIDIDIPAAPKTAPSKRKGDLQIELRTWRSRKARELGIPAYMIMHDSTLQEIADSMPLSAYDLEGIPGIGKEKIRRYGGEILDIVNR